MLKNFFKVAWRAVSKNKLYSIINVVGLSLAIGCFIVSYMFADFFFFMDDFHENGDRIYYVQNIVDRNGEMQLWGDSPVIFAPILEKDFPQVERAVRIERSGATVQYNDKVFDEGITYADHGFLDMFTFPLASGSKDALKDMNSVLISQEIKDKYFGDENPLGKFVKITFNENNIKLFEVKGVAQKFPRNASIRFNFLVPFKNFPYYEPKDYTNWEKWIAATFIQLKPNADIQSIKSQMAPYLRLADEVDEDWQIKSFEFQPFLSMFENSFGVHRNFSNGPHPMSWKGLALFGFMLLFLACFNFVNITIAAASRRFREIGIRKVVGGNRKQLVVQFLGENFLLCLGAAIVGIILADTYLVPEFSKLFGNIIALDLSTNYRFWIFLIGTLLFTVVSAGAYPAFYVSRFRPIQIFQAKHHIGGKPNRNLVTKFLLTFQFVLTFIMIVTSIIFYRNAKYQEKLDWGYEKEHAVAVAASGSETFKLLKNEVAKNSDVLEFTGSFHNIGRSSAYNVVTVDAKKYEFIDLRVGFDYLEMMGVRLKEGRFFDRNIQSDVDNAMMVNDTFVRHMKWDSPLGKVISMKEKKYTVVGVVEDFHYQPFWVKIRPAYIRVVPEANYFWGVARVKPGTEKNVIASLEGSWKRLFPNRPFFAMAQEDVFFHYFNEQKNVNKIVIFVGIIAIMISCMGLFGLVSQNMTKRMKEISIRKVLGANLGNIAKLVNREFVLLMCISILIGIPLGYMLNLGFMSGMTQYNAPILAVYFVVAFLTLAVTSLATISSQLYRAMTSQPAEMLRDE